MREVDRMLLALIRPAPSETSEFVNAPHVDEALQNRPN
jgi:hypothetical protein